MNRRRFFLAPLALLAWTARVARPFRFDARKEAGRIGRVVGSIIPWNQPGQTRLVLMIEERAGVLRTVFPRK